MQALFLMILGLVVLSAMFILDKPTNVSNILELSNLDDGSRVYTSSIVKDIRQYGDSYLIKLENNISAIIDDPLNLKNEIYLEGIKETYKKESRIRAISIIKHDS